LLCMKGIMTGALLDAKIYLEEGASATRTGYDRRTIEDQKEKGELVTYFIRNGLYGDNGRR